MNQLLFYKTLRVKIFRVKTFSVTYKIKKISEFNPMFYSYRIPF